MFLHFIAEKCQMMKVLLIMYEGDLSKMIYLDPLLLFIPLMMEPSI